MSYSSYIISYKWVMSHKFVYSGNAALYWWSNLDSIQSTSWWPACKVCFCLFSTLWTSPLVYCVANRAFKRPPWVLSYSGCLLCRKDYVKVFLEKEVGDHSVNAAAWNLHLLVKLGLKQKCHSLNKVTYVCMVWYACVVLLCCLYF